MEVRHKLTCTFSPWKCRRTQRSQQYQVPPLSEWWCGYSFLYLQTDTIYMSEPFLFVTTKISSILTSKWGHSQNLLVIVTICGCVINIISLSCQLIQWATTPSIKTFTAIIKGLNYRVKRSHVLCRVSLLKRTSSVLFREILLCRWSHCGHPSPQEWTSGSSVPPKSQ